MAALVPGMIVSVRAGVVSVDDAATPPTANVRIVDNNNNPITPATTLPQSLLTVVELPVAVNDVLEQISDGLTAVVRWVDPANPLRWSPSPGGKPDRLTTGWRKYGLLDPGQLPKLRRRRAPASPSPQRPR